MGERLGCPPGHPTKPPLYTPCPTPPQPAPGTPAHLRPPLPSDCAIHSAPCIWCCICGRGWLAGSPEGMHTASLKAAACEPDPPRGAAAAPAAAAVGEAWPPCQCSCWEASSCAWYASSSGRGKLHLACTPLQLNHCSSSGSPRICQLSDRLAERVERPQWQAQQRTGRPARCPAHSPPKHTPNHPNTPQMPKIQAKTHLIARVA